MYEMSDLLRCSYINLVLITNLFLAKTSVLSTLIGIITFYTSQQKKTRLKIFFIFVLAKRS